MRKPIQNLFIMTFSALAALAAMPVYSAPGDLIATVQLQNSSSVGGEMIPLPSGGIAYANPPAFNSTTIQIYAPPAGLGAQVATLIATKTLTSNSVSCIAWDSSRNQLWGKAGNGNSVYSIDIGDPTVSGNVTPVFEFNHTQGGISLCDGIAYDAGSDTLWISPDVNQNVYEYGLGGANALGALVSTVAPKNQGGSPDGSVSGVEVGSDNTLYIGRNGAQEIRRVDKTTGNFVSNFSQTLGRAEDLTCDPVTYAPLTALISKELGNLDVYEVFEVEPGTCTGPVVGPPPAPVSALGGYGLALLALLLGMAGLLVQRRKAVTRR